MFDGEETVEQNYVEVKTVKEIRPGRKLMCRRVTIDGGNTIADSEETGRRQATMHILFVHGSCAASRQFNDLLKSLSELNNKEQKIVCYLYDQLGCGESSHPPDDWDAFSSAQLAQDLHEISHTIINGIHGDENDESNESPLYIVGHSHGVSQTINLLQSMKTEPKKLSKVQGAIFIAGGLKDCPDCALTDEGGHWIFRYIPMFILRKMQPGLSESFLQAAVHPTNIEKLRKSALDISNGNDMAFCKAFYRQQKFVDSEAAHSLTVSGDYTRILFSTFFLIIDFHH